MRRKDKRERAIEIIKLRGTRHSNKICPLEMGPEGVVVYPNKSISEE